MHITNFIIGEFVTVGYKFSLTFLFLRIMHVFTQFPYYTHLILSSNLVSFTSGHVFAFGESRALAIANMVLGLKEIQIRGEIRTNVDYTIDLLNVNYSHYYKLFCERCLKC